MNGLVIEFNRRGARESRDQPSFWNLFGCMRPVWSSYWWCHRFAPWMGRPASFREDDAIFTESAEIWRPHALDRYGDKMMEEWIHLWAVDRSHGDPVSTISGYVGSETALDEFERTHAKVILDYIDSTCWYVFAREDDDLKRLESALFGRSDLRLRPIAFQNWRKDIDRRMRL